MRTIRCLLASLLMVFSGQSFALFMPEGFTIQTDTDAVSDGGCGALSVEADSAL